MRVAKIIATCFSPRAVREKTGFNNNPLGYFSHSQNFTTGEDVIRLIDFTIELESLSNPGCQTDLIIVNSRTGWTEGDQYLDSLHGRSLNHGKVLVMHRENVGLSFGSYNHAFSILGSDYDYYLFTEDDIILNGDHYVEIGINTFLKQKDCGFVAYLALGYDDNIEGKAAAAGGVGLTSYEVLNHVYHANGSLSYFNHSSLENRWQHILHGELAFTNDINKLGYVLTEIDPNIKLYDFAYDLMRGIKIDKRYASFNEKIIYYAKKNLMKSRIIQNINQFRKSNQLI